MHQHLETSENSRSNTSTQPPVISPSDPVRGAVVYSSKTGNTQKLAEVIYQRLVTLAPEKLSVDLVSIKEHPKLESYDFALVGSWVDRAKPDKQALRLIENTPQNNLGLFVTMGASPQSEHGERVTRNLAELLQNRNSLGSYLCPGYVDRKMLKMIKLIPSRVVPEKVKDFMYEASVNSRWATDEERTEAAEYFEEQVTTFLSQSQ